MTLTVPLYPDTPSRFKSRPQSRSEPEIDSISASSSFPYLHFHFHFHLLVAVSGPLLTYAIEPRPSLLLNFLNQLPLKPLTCPCFDLLCLCASSSLPFFFLLKRPMATKIQLSRNMPVTQPLAFPKKSLKNKDLVHQAAGYFCCLISTVITKPTTVR